MAGSQVRDLVCFNKMNHPVRMLTLRGKNNPIFCLSNHNTTAIAVENRGFHLCSGKIIIITLTSIFILVVWLSDATFSWTQRIVKRNLG
ncbi:hypothetical protein BDV33DRAFT_54995 [Aspergillus novoparasiticus]|uniref:Uncharacterized protein n=1 Tax=Aspergillus novoparasiticus TaxID=986946 RepID=A0A5N6F8R0_9EURO|nr:hypothetical protein BDV33DRAFT_54995 [Aspergillus novoparasiticus]